MLLLRDVKKSFPEPEGGLLPILSIQEFRLGEGEHAVLIGKSGSGKTTLLHTIAGISRPDSGLVQIDGVDITRLPEAGLDRFRADKIGYVFQTFNLLPAFSALENVMLGRACAWGRAGDWRARLGLSQRCSLWVSSSAWRSPAPWPIGQRSFWPMNRLPMWIRGTSSKLLT